MIQGNLVRKQYLISPEQIEKLELISKNEHISAAEVVRKAIDAYNPSEMEGMGASELMELVSQRLKDAIKSTRHASKVVDQTLEKLELEEF